MTVAFKHLGSTALPGMTAVATIDVLAGVRELADIASLMAAGWEHRPDVEARIPNRRFFNQPPGPGHHTRTFQPHIVKFDSPQWRVTVWGLLRPHPETAHRHLELKRSLASRLYENPSDYSAQKTPFVARVLARAASC